MGDFFHLAPELAPRGVIGLVGHVRNNDSRKKARNPVMASGVARVRGVDLLIDIASERSWASCGVPSAGGTLGTAIRGSHAMPQLATVESHKTGKSQKSLSKDRPGFTPGQIGEYSRSGRARLVNDLFDAHYDRVYCFTVVM